MNKFFIDSFDKAWSKTFNITASGKPREDTYKTAVRLGYKPLRIETYPQYLVKSLLLRRLLNVYNAISTLCQSLKFLKIKNSLLFTQYPFINPFFIICLRIMKHRNNKIVTLLHDFSYVGVSGKNEKGLLALSDVLIVHSPKMKNNVLSKGYNGQIVILEFFDYLNIVKRDVVINKDTINVLFAGSFIKSKFAYHLGQFDKSDIVRYILYGGGWCPDEKISNKIDYRGTFDSEELEHVQGNWGLVWDGESTKTCVGPYGQYLMYNAPFKLSLYLALGIPVIVWSESAMSSFVKKYHLGICVDSISDIQHTIYNLSEHEMEIMRKSISSFSEKVKSGKMLEKALSSVEVILL